MSGPSLHKLDAHRSIHNGVITEGRDLLELLLKVQNEKLENYEEHMKITADALIEHWKTRLIAHADSEEEGFYEEKLKQNPKLTEPLTKLKRDHDLFRIIITDIREEITKEKKITQDIIDRFKTIYVLAQIHNKEEENFLFHDDQQVS